MVPYTPGPFRAVAASPAIRRQASHPALGQRFDQLLEWGAISGDVLRLTVHSLSAYLGYYVWLSAPKKSFPKYFGLGIGVLQTFGGICDLISLAQRATGTHPPENACPPGIPLGK